ncbi:unnamed protein product [Schistocephalus solidus]|uniref:GLOBIN domain-containing protein n=1 Tax=Schistocephalus solidus TaxID=70667 RepID=A0A183T8X6_SCHSO|nr:unnamed protein product [Schistocephalus solidus]
MYPKSTRLFTKYPHYIRLFKRFRDLPNLDSIMQSAAFKAHAMRFIGAIDDIMENLDDDSCLVELLKRLAEEHHPRGIRENDFCRALDIAYDALSPVLKSNNTRAALRQLFNDAAHVIHKSLEEEDEEEREEKVKKDEERKNEMEEVKSGGEEEEEEEEKEDEDMEEADSD